MSNPAAQPCRLSTKHNTCTTCLGTHGWSTGVQVKKTVYAVEDDDEGHVADKLKGGRHDVLDHVAEEGLLPQPVPDGVLPVVPLVRLQLDAGEQFVRLAICNISTFGVPKWR